MSKTKEYLNEREYGKSFVHVANGPDDYDVEEVSPKQPITPFEIMNDQMDFIYNSVKNSKEDDDEIPF